MHTTSPTLLDRLRRPDDPEAWDRFVRLYSAGLYSWARGLGLQHADAADLVQDVFAALVQKLPDFRYDAGRSFRGWLWTLTRNKCVERMRGRRPAVLPAADLDRLADPADESVAEEEFRRHLIGRVVRVLEADFPPDVWRAFWAHVVDGRPASRVADELGINLWAVYTAKVRVLAHLHKELADLVAD